jgi:hypothetical protein
MLQSTFYWVIRKKSFFFNSSNFFLHFLVCISDIHAQLAASRMGTQDQLGSGIRSITGSGFIISLKDVVLIRFLFVYHTSVPHILKSPLLPKINRISNSSTHDHMS